MEKAELENQQQYQIFQQHLLKKESETVQDAEPLKQTVIEAFPESDMAKKYEKLADMILSLQDK